MPLTDLQDAKEQVRQAIDIVDLANGYMALRRQGRGYVAVCPWHDDTRPSLQVNPDRQSFKCWVCNIGGDIFSFIMRMEGLDFREALEMLADRAGIELAPAKRHSGQSSEFERRNLLRAVAWAEEQFHRCLIKDPEAEAARNYLTSRGIQQETTEKFQLGFAPNRWDWLLEQSQVTDLSPAVLERVGLVARRQNGPGFYDRFRGRLIFPIRDTRSRPIAFGGRILPGMGNKDSDRTEAKYINSPETPLFNKSSQLYALDLAKDGIAQQKCIVIMEGYTDVIMAHQHGIDHAVAVLGTALGDKHVPLLRRFTDSITLVLDGDDAGQSRTMQILDELLALFVAQEIDLRILTLPQGADPCDVIASQGSESFRQLLSTAVDALEHKITAVTKGLVLDSDKVHGSQVPGTHASAQAVEEILGTLVRAFPKASSATSVSLVREQQVMSRISRQFGITEETIRTRLGAKRRDLAAKQRKTSVSRSHEMKSVSEHHISDESFSSQPLLAWDKELIELLLHHPQVVTHLADKLAPEKIQNVFCRNLYDNALRMMESGQTATYEQLMLLTDDVHEKNLLVECDETGKNKAVKDAMWSANDLIERLNEQELESRQN
ncbi:MAG TPA: DNA primase [Planctomycetaceae bacterium]|nr:DNA primase [Planctomycetaceae bacterium]